MVGCLCYLTLIPTEEWEALIFFVGTEAAALASSTIHLCGSLLRARHVTCTNHHRDPSDLPMAPQGWADYRVGVAGWWEAWGHTMHNEGLRMLTAQGSPLGMQWEGFPHMLRMYCIFV